MDISDLPAGYFAGGDVIACQRCGNRVLDGACLTCGAEPEGIEVERIVPTVLTSEQLEWAAAGLVPTRTISLAEFRAQFPAKDDDDRWLWHRMQAEFRAWGTK